MVVLVGLNVVIGLLLQFGWLREDQVSVSGEALFGGPKRRAFLSLSTSMFAHLDAGHFLNNMAMMVYPMYAFQPHGCVVVYIVAGIVGPLFSIAMSWLFYRDAWREGVAQFSTTFGSSPSTYAICFFASLSLDSAVAVSAHFTGLYAMLVAPIFCSSRFGLRLWPRFNGIAIFVALALFAGFAILMTRVVVNASTWLALYCAKIAFFGACDAILYGRRPFGADNASHLGGAIVGILFWFLTSSSASRLSSSQLHYTLASLSWMIVLFLNERRY